MTGDEGGGWTIKDPFFSLFLFDEVMDKRADEVRQESLCFRMFADDTVVRVESW